MRRRISLAASSFKSGSSDWMRWSARWTADDAEEDEDENEEEDEGEHARGVSGFVSDDEEVVERLSVARSIGSAAGSVPY